MSFDLHDFQARQAEAIAQLDEYKSTLTDYEKNVAECTQLRENATRELQEFITHTVNQGVLQPVLFESLGIVPKAGAFKKPNQQVLAIEGDELRDYVSTTITRARELQHTLRAADEEEQRAIAQTSEVRKEYHEAIKSVLSDNLLPKAVLTQLGHIASRRK